MHDDRATTTNAQGLAPIAHNMYISCRRFAATYVSLGGWPPKEGTLGEALTTTAWAPLKARHNSCSTRLRGSANARCSHSTTSSQHAVLLLIVLGLQHALEVIPSMSAPCSSFKRSSMGSRGVGHRSVTKGRPIAGEGIAVCSIDKVEARSKVRTGSHVIGVVASSRTQAARWPHASDGGIRRG